MREGWHRALVCVSLGPSRAALVCASLGLAMATALVYAAPGPAAGAEAPPLGISSFAVQTTRARAVPSGPGLPGYGFVDEPYAYTQAGGHPEAITSTLEFSGGRECSPECASEAKDVAVELPPGLSADVSAVPQCSQPLLSTLPCPAASQVGVYVLRFRSGGARLGAIFALTPRNGQPSVLGLEMKHVLAMAMYGRIARAADGYGLALEMAGLPPIGAAGVELTLWGVPAGREHDPERGLSCQAVDAGGSWECEGGGEQAGVEAAPFLTLGSDCAAGPASATAFADSWEEPGRYAEARTTLPTVTGCELLPFRPELEVGLETGQADAPLGLAVKIQNGPPPAGAQGQTATEAAQSQAVPPVRSANVTLPSGVSLNPAGASGLKACPATGPEGIDMPAGVSVSGQPLTPSEVGEGEQAGQDGLKILAPGHCPEASTVGEAQALSPLLSQALKGRLYLAQPGCGQGRAPCGEQDALDGSLYRFYVELGGVAEASVPGVVVKAPVQLRANPSTGQLTVVLSEAPQLPLSRLTLKLTGGPKALLASPAGCGRAVTSAEFASWSAPGLTPLGLFVAGTPDATSSSYYEVAGCTTPPGLVPGLVAGTTSSQAGGFSPFTLTVTRQDREQYLSALQVQLPAGLLGMLGSVPLCPGPAAGEGSCPGASRIGSSLVAAGAGSAPLELRGSVYLSGPYDDAPFGLSIVTDATVGPFDLGRLVLRARLAIDPHSGAISIASDALPQALDGIPLRLRRLTIDVDRPGFVVNPTDCSAKRIEATVAGALGAIAHVSSPFAVGSCRTLSFRPAVSATASGRASAEGNGASLDLKLAFPGWGEGANVARMRLTLPGQLAARLPTLQRACEEVVFAADPAACPRASVVGVARGRTPVLSGEMAGPIYLVSHGVAALPSLLVVLQGDGVRLDLAGATDIGRDGATSVDFGQVPDVPLEGFEAYLPRGPHSELGANANLCKLSRIALVRRTVPRRVRGSTVRRAVSVRVRVAHSAPMTTTLVAQNGLVFKRVATLAIAGCPTRGIPRSPGSHSKFK